jgi:hypothetical protein
LSVQTAPPCTKPNEQDIDIECGFEVGAGGKG